MDIDEELLLSKLRDLEEHMRTLHRYHRIREIHSIAVENRLQSIECKLADVSNRKTVEKNMEEKVHYKFVDYVSSLVGLKEAIGSKHRGVKYVWAILFVLGITCTVYYFYKTTIEYLEEPTVTKIKLNTSGSYDIPEVAICPSAWMDTDKALSLGLTTDAYKYSLFYVDNYVDLQISNASRARMEFLNFYNSQNYTSLLHYFRSITSDLPTVYTTQEYDNQSQVIKLGDQKAKLSGKQYVNFGVCSTYKSKPLGQSSYSTIVYFVKLLDKTRNILKITPGIWIYLVINADFLYSEIPPVAVPAFSRSKLVINAKRFVMMNRPPDSPCDEELDDAYTSFACTMKCRNVKYKQYLQCRTFKHSFISERLGHAREYCNFLDKLTSDGQNFDAFRSSNKKEEIARACTDVCPPKCDRTIFQLSVQWQETMTIEREVRWSGFRNRSIDEGSNTNGSIEIDPYRFELYIEHGAKYEGEIVSLIEVSSYSSTELINNIGGTLGLFVGATIMTFVQMILFFVEHFCDKRSGRSDLE